MEGEGKAWSGRGLGGDYQHVANKVEKGRHVGRRDKMEMISMKGEETSWIKEGM